MATDTVLQDQRKRTLEALERRFAVEHLLQQKKNKNSLNEGDKKEHNRTSSSVIVSLADKTDAAVAPTLGASSKKGFYFFIFYFI
jgi:ribonuclease P protein subunit POP4